MPGLGPHAVVVAPGGAGDLATLLRTLGRGLYVQRFSGTVDPSSGDFSGVAKSARWIEGGESVRSLRETLISGNAFELLKDAVTLGSVSERIMGLHACTARDRRSDLRHGRLIAAVREALRLYQRLPAGQSCY